LPPSVPNQPLVAGALAYSVRQGQLLLVPISAGLLSNVSNPDNGTLSLSDNGQVAHGSLDVRPDGSFDYVPFENYTGQDGFNYTVTDGTAYTTAAVTITISEFMACINSPGGYVLKQP
jgi:hypothetical protein